MALARRSVVISAFGADRVGIIHDLSGIVAAQAGSISDSKMMKMGHDFGVLMRVDFPTPAAVNELHVQLAEVDGVRVSVLPTKEGPAPARAPFKAHFKLSGADDSGIVHAACGLLRDHSLSIVDMRSYQKVAPFGGTVIFCLEGEVSGAAAPDLDVLQEDCEALEGKLGCDLTVSVEL